MHRLIILLSLLGLALTACPLNCATCSDPTCSACKTGYYLSLNMCNPCQGKCQTCNNGSSCASCISGYYLNSISSCQLCPSNCKTCPNSTFCSNCNSGFFANNAQCKSCPSNCQTCSSPSTCSICTSGYYLNGISCQICQKNCLTCTTNSTCQSCINDSLIVWSGRCISCPANCVSCSNNSCQACIRGSYLYSKYCYLCISNCDSCSNSTSCDLCASGYSYSQQNAAKICLQNSTSSGLVILMPIFSSILSCILIVICIYRARSDEPEEGVEVAESNDRIIPIEFDWKQYENRAKQQEEICPICLDAFPQLETKCSHFFHRKCLVQWCESKKTCPFCRQAISELRFICPDCKKSYLELEIGQARILKDDKCRQCQNSIKV